MTEFSQFWQGTTPGDAGAYSSDQFSTMMQNIMGDANNGDSGPLTGTGTEPDPGLTVQQRGAGANMSVDVTAGAALVDGTFYTNSATVNLVVTSNSSGNPRVDTVILRKTWATQTVRLVVKVGTPAGSPTPPAMTQTPGTTWEIPLYDIAVANGALSITNANITPHKSPANIADGIYLQGILNNSGGTLVNGDVVVIDTSADRAVKTTTTANDLTVLGVWVGRTANAAYGRVQISGVAYVNANAAVTRGQDLVASTSAKQAAPATADTQMGAFASALQTTGGAGLVLALLSPMPGLRYVTSGKSLFVVNRNNGANYTTVSNTPTPIDNTNLNSGNMMITTGRVRITFTASIGEAAAHNCSLYVFMDTVQQRVYSFSNDGSIAGGLLGHLVSLTTILTGLSVGNHTFVMEWSTSAGTATMLANGILVSFNVEEF